MKFSIICPSRERPVLLTNLCRSIEETTKNKDEIELHVIYDVDDTATAELKLDYTWLYMHSRPRANNLSVHYFNWIKPQCTGKYFMLVNDDCAFKTPHWDEIASNALEAYLADKPDGIVYGWIFDSLLVRQGNVNYCCFPLLSKIATDVVEYVQHPHFSSWQADEHLYRLYNAIGRVCNIEGIWIDHISYHSGKRERDETSYHVQRIASGGIPDLNPDISKLQAHIANFSK